MRYAIVKCVNGNYSVHAEGYTDINSAKTAFHQLCASLWHAPDVVTATVQIVDENLDNAEWYKDTITHPVEVNNVSE